MSNYRTVLSPRSVVHYAQCIFMSLPVPMTQQAYTDPDLAAFIPSQHLEETILSYTVPFASNCPPPLELHLALATFSPVCLVIKSCSGMSRCAQVHQKDSVPAADFPGRVVCRCTKCRALARLVQLCLRSWREMMSRRTSRSTPMCRQSSCSWCMTACPPAERQAP